MLQQKASKHISPNSESNPVEIATLDEHATVTSIGQEPTVSAAEATVLLVQEFKLSVSPAEVTCGQVVPFQIEQGGPRYTPNITGANGMLVKLSTVASSWHADTTLTNTKIFSPCRNNNVKGDCEIGDCEFSECSFHTQEETVTVSVGASPFTLVDRVCQQFSECSLYAQDGTVPENMGRGWERRCQQLRRHRQPRCPVGSRSGLAYLAVDCEEYIPTTTTTAPPDPVRCTEPGKFGIYAATCSECATSPFFSADPVEDAHRREEFSHPYNNGNNNGFCQGDCRWNNPSTHDTCVAIEEGASGNCPSECFQTSSRDQHNTEICNVPDSYANKYSMPPGDRVCYHMCMLKPHTDERSRPTYITECGDSSEFFNINMRPLWCCGCQPEGFQDGTDQCQILTRELENQRIRDSEHRRIEEAENRRIQESNHRRYGLIQTSNDVLDVESKAPLQDSGAGDKDGYQAHEDHYGQDKDQDDQKHHGQDKH